MDKTTMYKLTYGLFVLTAKDGKDNGCITNTAMQVTSTPNRIAVAINKANFTHDMVLKTGVFNISILSEKAPFSLFQRFGFQSGRDTDKFADYGAFARAENGVVYVTEGTNAVILAKVVSTADLGTHTLFVADVTDGFNLTDDPSVTYAYYQANIKPKPAAPKSEKKTVWRCTVCGYEYEGEELPDDFICPLCKHPKEDFEKVSG